MADGRTQMDEASSQKDEPSSQTDFDVPSRNPAPYRDGSEGERKKEDDLAGKPQEDLTANDLKGDARDEHA
jgi:hypothetical protein